MNKRPKKGKALRDPVARVRNTRQRFLDATAKLLAERSVLDISVTEIAREVDTGSSLFYYYFKSVEDAALELAREASAEMADIVVLIDGSWEGEEGLRRARDLAAAYLEHWERNHGVLLLRNQAADRGDKLFLSVRKQALEPLIQKLAELIAQSQRQGRVARDLHPFLAASALVSILEKLSAYGQTLRYFNASRKDLVRTCARIIATTVTGRWHDSINGITRGQDVMGVLDGKAAVVTGAGRGIGRGHALQLAKAGADVVVNDIDGDVAAEVVAEIEAFGGRAIGNTGNVGDKAGADSIVAACVAAFGKIDIMMANAGIALDRTFLKMTEADFDAVMTIHVKGTFLCHQAAALQIKEQGTGGSLVSTVSAAHFGNFGQVNYAGAKGAIASMTYTMALELARYGIRANAISPSGTTRMSDTYVGPDGKKHPMPFIDPELNGPVLVYLCSDEGNYISGQIFGTGGERIALLSQPRYGHTLFMPGGWTLEAVQQHFKSNLGSRLEPLGITKPPYPFANGILPPEAKS